MIKYIFDVGSGVKNLLINATLVDKTSINNNGSMTRRSHGIDQIVPIERVEMSPQDAETLGITDRNWVLVSSRRGKLKVRAKAAVPGSP